MTDWIDRTEKYGEMVYKRVMRNYKRLKEGRYRKKGMFYKGTSGERAIPIIEAIISDNILMKAQLMFQTIISSKIYLRILLLSAQ